MYTLGWSEYAECTENADWITHCTKRRRKALELDKRKYGLYGTFWRGYEKFNWHKKYTDIQNVLK